MVRQLLGRQIVLYDPVESTGQNGRSSGIYFTGSTVANSKNYEIASIESSGCDDASSSGRLNFKVNNGTLNEIAMYIDGKTRSVNLVSSLNINSMSGNTGQSAIRMNDQLVLTDSQLVLSGNSIVSLGDKWRFVVENDNLKIQFNVNNQWNDKATFRPE